MAAAYGSWKVMLDLLSETRLFLPEPLRDMGSDVPNDAVCPTSSRPSAHQLFGPVIYAVHLGHLSGNSHPGCPGGPVLASHPSRSAIWAVRFSHLRRPSGL